jgi:hypothetical protein
MRTLDQFLYRYPSTGVEDSKPTKHGNEGTFIHTGEDPEILAILTMRSKVTGGVTPPDRYDRFPFCITLAAPHKPLQIEHGRVKGAATRP